MAWFTITPIQMFFPPFKHAGISMRLAWDHACSQTPATGFDSGTGSAFPSRPQLSSVPLWSASLTWLLEHRAGHLSHMGWGTRIYWSTAIKSSLCLVWLEWFQLISGFHSSTLKWSHEACFGGHRPMVEWFQEVWLELFPTWRLRKQKHSWFMNHLDLYNDMYIPEKNLFPTKSPTT